MPRPNKSQAKSEKAVSGVKSPASSDKPALKKVPSEKKLKVSYFGILRGCLNVHLERLQIISRDCNLSSSVFTYGRFQYSYVPYDRCKISNEFY